MTIVYIFEKKYETNDLSFLINWIYQFEFRSLLNFSNKLFPLSLLVALLLVCLADFWTKKCPKVGLIGKNYESCSP